MCKASVRPFFFIPQVHFCFLRSQEFWEGIGAVPYKAAYCQNRCGENSSQAVRERGKMKPAEGPTWALFRGERLKVFGYYTLQAPYHILF